MLDSIYHMKIKLLNNSTVRVKMSRLCHLLRNVIVNVITLSYLRNKSALAVNC